MPPLFLYGTLRHPPLLAAVSGSDALSGVAATLADHTIAHAVGTDGVVQSFPLFAERPGAQALGLLIRPDAAARARLDAYERAFGYDTSSITVQTADGPVEAAIYLPQAALWRPGPKWSLADWVKTHGALTVETAGEVMALLPHTPPEAVRARYRMLEMRVSSRWRAQADPAPTTLRRQPSPGDVTIAARDAPYVRFFGVDEADLRFRRFDGTMSASVKRAAFVMSDAVTVLPYDPVRDTVLVIEQFRFGPMTRGAPNCWSLEPIAGRIDPHETPEQALRRETREEAGIELGALLPIAGYYPSPAAVSEFLYSYVGLADLEAGQGGLGGLESEAEDIRTHVIPFDRLMAVVDSGEVQNGPLLLSAFWLARHRDALRREHAPG
ncbi:MAG: ADP-ribose pyrophosphatase [Rhodobacteraceae bacterium HLUCCA12]|nr:MAG: ADP-ribose pyrophosphatase [Rhodobacteraceae bacterium HLUCCA12]